MRSIVVAACVAVVGCSGSSSPIGPDPSGGAWSSTGDMQGGGYESGSRLRAVVVTGVDGSKQFVRWHDSMRDEDCHFATADDGKTRCLPNDVAAAVTYFSDATCSKAVVSTPPGDACGEPSPPKYASWTSTSSCAVTKHVAPVGAKIQALNLYSVDAQGACTGPKTPQPPGWIYYATGKEIAPTEFVEATESVE